MVKRSVCQLKVVKRGIIIIIEKARQCKVGKKRESDLHAISPKTPAPQYQPIERKKREGKQ